MIRIIAIFLSLSIVHSSNFHKQEQFLSQDVHNSGIEVIDVVMDGKQQRNLQEIPPRNMKITYDMSSFNNLNLSDPEVLQTKQFIEKGLQVTIQFFHDFLTIVPKPPGYMKIKQKSCQKVTIPEEDKDLDRDSDLHLYITHFDDPKIRGIIDYKPCRIVKNFGTTHGFVRFNFLHIVNKKRKGNLIFSDMITKLITETISILGFSKVLLEYWVDSNQKPYTNPTSINLIRGRNTTLLSTPNVLSHAREYYNCQNLPGMPLDVSEKGSSVYWDSKIMIDEIMSSSLQPNSYFLTLKNIASNNNRKFTTSMLRDTGYFASVNSDFEEDIYFGKDAGCSFVLGECDTKRAEYCTSGKRQCDFYGFSVSSCTSELSLDRNCSTFRHVSGQQCFLPQSGKEVLGDQVGVSYGINSRCFVSDLSKSNILVGREGTCYSYTCNEANEISIQLGNKIATCTQNNQIVNVDGFSGSISCPDNLEKYCNSKKFCPNFCSSNGYCLKGVCKCLNGFTGIDCSEQLN